MNILKRTTAADLDFQNLTIALDQELESINGDENNLFIQFNKIDKNTNAIVFYINKKAVGCGAFKKYDDETAEIKRMFVLLNYRGKGIALKILNELERWAIEMNYSKFILETGEKQPEAIRLYQKAGYSIIPNFGQYENINSSVCFNKSI